MNNKSMLTIFLFSFVSFVFTGTAYGGAWTAEKGAMYNKLSYNYYYADEAFDDSGSREDFANNGEFTDNNVSYYVEYGATDIVTVLGSLTYKWLESEGDTYSQSNDGLSDLELGLKGAIYTGKYGTVSLQGLIKIPEFYDEDDAPELGNGQYDYEFRLLYGRSTYPMIPGYYNFELGYRFRDDAPADEVRYLIEIGVDFTSKFYGRVKLDGVYGVGNGDDVDSGPGNPTISLDYDLGKLDTALGYKITDNWMAELGYRPEIYGENVSAGSNWSVSVVYGF